ncbi:MAG: nicotinate-nucleotide adenylyltransferase [Chloroflexota bacterium]|nr:nicotinate-nucleotide adenylyltransferase [Chloroflexota bacterium]
MTSNLKPQTGNLKLGVLGGTFDPPHNGHLVIAQEALTQLDLAQVIFAPTRQPPHKLGQEVTPIKQRLDMVRLAIAANPRFALSRVDVDRAGPTYTVDTIRLLRDGLGEDAEIYFIMGLDSFATILAWHAPDQLIRLCRLAVFNRPGFAVDLAALEARLPGVRERATLLPSPALDIAASDLQHRVRAGQSIKHLVPDAVAAYIMEHGLYLEKM